MTDPTLRFSSRVENYIKYRPHYPPAVIATLREECQLASAALIADIGSGTGLLTELFLQSGNQVFAVEPNREMRAAGERLLRNYPGFHSVAGRAEATTLADQSVGFVVAGQAFHWFDRQKARSEFCRILRPAGWVMLVWNEREDRATPFLMAYEQLLQRYATDYVQVNHKQVDEATLADFYGVQGFKSETFSQRQDFDYAGVRGRLLSSSYTPEVGYPDYEPMLAELSKVFQAHEINGRVRFEYTTRMYYGQLS
ncbi:MAG TPA: class I SAM-dependent methyltransferase [Candidatus Fraserbacteria bacterium]|nr:class I SAM-dependent methyltransferase [Candidatus Fraserbacteria bacterium]